MRRTGRWVMAVALAQASLIGLYWLVEHQRAPSTVESLGTAPPQRIDMAMPTLTIRRRDGGSVELPSSGRRTLVHVWATWCPPCRAELPSLLELQSQHEVAVVAIALDESWDEVERFLGDVDSSKVVLAASEDVERALGVRDLPVTFLLEENGRLALRFDGARDWTDEAFVQTYIEEHGGDR